MRRVHPRCFGVKGGWCAAYHSQRPLPLAAPPLGAKECPKGCSGAGVCNADIGRCDCSAGWSGADCSQPDKRPCTNTYSNGTGVPASHIGPGGEDLDWMAPGFTPSRCTGTCDDNTGACFCGGGGPYARIPARPGAAPGAPPEQPGRVLMGKCQRVRTDAEGRPLPWIQDAAMPYDMIYGNQGGWCTSARPVVRCDCVLDGYDGPACDERTEPYCPNACSGRGECERGWCRCQSGWYGLDCARRAAIAPLDPEPSEAELKAVAAAAAALAAAAKNPKRRFATIAAEPEPQPLYVETPLVRERPWLRNASVDQWAINMPPAPRRARRANASADAAGGEDGDWEDGAEEEGPVGGQGPAGAKAAAMEAAAAAKERSAVGVGAGAAAASSAAAAAPQTPDAAASSQTPKPVAPAPAPPSPAAEPGVSAAAAPAGKRHARALLRHFRIGGGALEGESASAAPPQREKAPPARSSAESILAVEDEETLIHGLGASGRMRGFGPDGDYAPGDAYDEEGSPSSGSGGHTDGLLGAGGRTRRRPLVFVYDAPAAFVGRMLQYRTAKEQCVWRLSTSRNRTTFPANTWRYAMESYFHEALLRSEHRTLNPEEADLFYVPVYASCLMEAVLGHADKPWYYQHSDSKVQHATLMYQAALEWIKTAYPYWNRTQGRDHVWLFSHDEGACWAPAEIYANSIILTHFGPAPPASAADALPGALFAEEQQLPRPSGTTRRGYNYSANVKDAYLPEGWTALMGAHPCYDPKKDILIPAFRPPAQYHAAMALAGAQRKRDILLLLRGEMGDNRPKEYSGGLRQEVYALARDLKWSAKYSIKIGNTREVEGDYSMLMSRSTFCLVLPGDGWVSLFEDAVVHGCVPVYVTGGPRDIHPPFDRLLKWGEISILVDRAELPRLPQILTNVDRRQLGHMQRRMARLWHRLVYLDHPSLLAQASDVMRLNFERYPWINQEQAKMEKLIAEGKLGDAIFPATSARLMRASDARDDAFNTVMQFLHHKARRLHGDTGRLALTGAGGSGKIGGPGYEPGLPRRRRSSWSRSTGCGTRGGGGGRRLIPR